MCSLVHGQLTGVCISFEIFCSLSDQVRIGSQTLSKEIMTDSFQRGHEGGNSHQNVSQSRLACNETERCGAVPESIATPLHGEALPTIIMPSRSPQLGVHLQVISTAAR